LDYIAADMNAKTLTQFHRILKRNWKRNFS